MAATSHYHVYRGRARSLPMVMSQIDDLHSNSAEIVAFDTHIIDGRDHGVWCVVVVKAKGPINGTHGIEGIV